MKIRAVIFDLDNTLYDYDAAHAAAFPHMAAAARAVIGLDEAAFAAAHREAMAEQVRRAGMECAAIHNRLIRCQIILERYGKPVAYAPRIADAYWTAFLDAMRPVPGVRGCLTELRAAGYRVGLGSNMTADYQYAKLARLDLLERMDFIVTSEETCVEKPDRRLFDLCVQKAGCPAGECVFVGDNRVHDVDGARAAGLVPVWLHPDDGPCDGYRVAALSQLPALLRTLEGPDGA